MGSSNLGEGCQDAIGRDADTVKDRRRAAVAVLEHGDEQMLGRDVVVVHPLGDGVRVGEDAARLVREGQLGRGALHGGQLRQLRTERIGDRCGRDPHPLQHRRHHAVRLVDQHEQEVRSLELRMALALRERLRVDDRVTRAGGEAFDAHQDLGSGCG